MPRRSRRLQTARGASEGNGVGSVSEALGATVRRERLAAGLTLRELASRTGLSPSLISQIERGRATPSVASLWSIASELGLSIADLFRDADPNGAGGSASRTVTPLQPHETRASISLAGGIRWERLTPRTDEEIDFLYVVYPVGAASCEEDALNRHGGREFGYVISGTLEVEIGFDRYVVRANDSIAFDSMLPHRLKALGDEPVHAIWAVLNRRGDRRTQSFG